MQVEMKNYRGVSEARLTMAPIALVAGPNGAGKSSIAQGIAAALTKNAAPIDGIAKNAAGQLLRDGAKRGNCTVGDDTGSVTANWPGASTSEDGSPPWASEIACGLTSLVDMKPKDAAALLIKAIEALPTLEHLQAALPDIGAEMQQQVWAAVQNDGWDSAHTRAKDRGAKIKGAWEHVTGEKYGSQKAEGWRHPRLAEGEFTDQMLADEVGEIRAELEDALQNQAVGAAQLEQLKQQAASGEAALAELRELQPKQNQLASEVGQLKEVLDTLPRPETGESYIECPHCKGHLVVVSRSEVRAPTAGLGERENAAREQEIQRRQTELQTAEQALRESDRRVEQLQAVIRGSDVAKAAVAEAEAQASASTPEAVNQLRQDLAEAEADLAAFRAAIQAGAYHKQIGENQLVIDALAPDGIRQTVLAEKMGNFNATLARLSGTAGWPVVALADDLSLSLGGRPYILLSESEKFRVRVTLQVALADLDGSDVVLIDAADILDRAGRNGLFKMVSSSGMRALVCMTMNQLADVPNLAAAGLGGSYWLADNILAPVGAQ